jgi:hypothetical protein
VARAASIFCWPRGFFLRNFLLLAKFEWDIEDTVKSLAWDWFRFAPEDPGTAWANAIPHTRSIVLPALNTFTGMELSTRNVST